MSAIDYSWPITSGLVAAYVFTDGSTTNIINGLDALTITGDAFLDVNGLNAPATGTFTGAQLTSPPSNFLPIEVTIMWFGKILGNGGLSNNPALAIMFHNNSNASPYSSYGIGRSALGFSDLYGLYSETTNPHNVLATTGIDTGAYGTPVNYLMTRTSGATKLWRDGVTLISDSVSGDISYGPTPVFRINNHITVGGDASNTNTAIVFIWNRVLTDSEIGDLSINPRFFLVDSDFARGDIVFEGSTVSEILNNFGDAKGNIIFEGDVFGTSGFLGSGVGDIAIEGSISSENLSIVAFAQGDIVFPSDIEGSDGAVPVTCITGDGTYVPPSAGGGGTFAY